MTPCHHSVLVAQAFVLLNLSFAMIIRTNPVIRETSIGICYRI